MSSALSRNFVGAHRVSVLDARALGDPGFLGEAHIDVASLALEPNSPPVNLWLPLKVCHAGSIADSTHILFEAVLLMCDPR